VGRKPNAKARGDEQEPDTRCGALRTSGHVTSEVLHSPWGVLYKSGVYVRKATSLTPGDLRSCPRGLGRWQQRSIAPQESAEGIVRAGNEPWTPQGVTHRSEGLNRIQGSTLREGARTRPAFGRLRPPVGRDGLGYDSNGKPPAARRGNGTARYVIRSPGGVGGAAPRGAPLSRFDQGQRRGILTRMSAVYTLYDRTIQEEAS
jgi:hypothetical protein